MENDNATPAEESPAATHSPSPSYADDDDYERDRRRTRLYSAFLPLLLLFVATVAWPAFQCWQLVAEKQAMATVRTNQTKTFEDATKLRGTLEGIARDTALLAEQGHPGAKMIVDELARRGVKIDPNATPSSPPGAQK